MAHCKPIVESLEGRALLAAAAPRAVGRLLGVEIYRVTFESINGSGVVGQGTLKIAVRGVFGTNNSALTIRLKGLERGQPHAVEFVGFNYLTPTTESRPPQSAADDDPSPEGLGNDIISDSEGRPFYGDSSSEPIRPIPAARKAGARNFYAPFRLYYDARHPPALQAFVIRGLTVAGQYQPTVPVAYGSLKLIRVVRY